MNRSSVKSLIRFLKQTTLFLFGLLFFLVVTVVGIVGLIWWKPELVINPKTLAWARTKAPAEFLISWRDIQFQTTPLNWHSKSVKFQTDQLCFAWQDTVSSCSDKIDLEFSFSLSRRGAEILDVRHLFIDIKSLDLKTRADAKARKSKPVLPDLRLPLLAKYFPKQLDLDLIEQVFVRVQEYKWQQLPSASVPSSQLTASAAEKDAPISGSLSVERARQNSELLTLNLKTKLNQSNSLAGDLNGVFVVDPRSPAVTFEGDFAFTKGALKVQSPVRASYNDQLKVEAKPVVNFKKLNLTSPLTLFWNDQRLQLKSGAIKLAHLWAQGVIDIDSCEFHSQLAQGPKKFSRVNGNRSNQDLGYPQKNSLACSLRLKLHERRPPVEKLRAQLQAEIQVEPQSEATFWTGLNVRLQGDENFGRGRIDGQAEFEINAKDRKILGTPKLNLTADLQIPEIQVWIQAFKDTPWSVPAPLHTLRGPIRLTAQSSVESQSENLLIFTEIVSDLKDSQQKLLSKTKVEAKLLGPIFKPAGLDLKMSALLQDIQIQAPPLRLQSPPQFVPDSHFVSVKDLQKKTAKKFPVTWHLALETGKPVVITSNLLKSPMPLSLKLKMGSQSAVTGQVRVVSVPLELFRKKAQLEQVQVSFEPGSKFGLLDGLIHYETSEVKIKISVLGTTQKPRIEFQSDPPLNRSQILSVILYNKSLNDLTEEEASSAGNFNKALSDGAFGLFSLVFLSATPIQSIGYDPVTQTYNARVKLDDNTSLNLGSDFSDSRQLTVRRRLKGRWSLSTELKQEENQTDSVLTLLEWFQRYQ